MSSSHRDHCINLAVLLSIMLGKLAQHNPLFKKVMPPSTNSYHFLLCTGGKYPGKFQITVIPFLDGMVMYGLKMRLYTMELHNLIADDPDDLTFSNLSDLVNCLQHFTDTKDWDKWGFKEG